MASTRFANVAWVLLGAALLTASVRWFVGSGQLPIENGAGHADALGSSEVPEPFAPSTRILASAPLVAPVPATVPSTLAGNRALDEPTALEKLRGLAASDPVQSLQLAREALQRFPQSPNAPEFAWNVVKALFNMEQLEEAKAEARIMLWKYPGTYFANDVDHHLLNHPPNPPELQ